MKLTLRARLVLMVMIPLAGMLGVSAWNTIEKMTLSREMGRLQGLVAVATHVGTLVHELQKERGMSVGFIGSRGANFSDTLPKQRTLSDGERKALAGSLDGFDSAYFGRGFVAHVGEARRMLDELDAKRQAISALSMPAPDAIGYYTKTIAALLAISGDLPTLSSDAHIARLATAYGAFLQAKEQAGIERATLSNVFIADRFGPELLARFVRVSGAQDTWLGIFRQYATETNATFAADTIQGAAVNEVAETRKAAIAKMNEPSLSMDAKKWFAASTARIDLMKTVEDRLAGDMNTAMADIERAARLITWGYGIALVAVTLIVLFIIRIVTGRVMAQIGGEPETAVAVAHAVAGGKLDNEIALVTGDDSSLLASMKRMQTQLLDRITAERQVAAENLRIKIALDNVSTGVMIADTERRIIYVNKSVQAILRDAAEGIGKQLPGFDPGRLVGASIDVFHKDPAHQAALLAQLASPHVANLEIGDRHMTVTANSVFGDKGERLGTVAEWQDRTAEVAVEREVEGIIVGATDGDFSRRLSVEGKTGFFRNLAEGLNQMLENTAHGLDDVATVLRSVARGDLTKSVEAEYRGVLGELKDDANTTIGRLREVVGRIKEATEAINTAAQEIAAGNQDLSSRTEEQASSLEETASSMEELNATVRQNADNSRQANELAKNSNEVATRGGQMVKQVVDTMTGIQDSSKKIADIIGVIDSIAFQTNILALNAAVEAARAGEQGRGFAVVATEVRNLAQRSATAAKEIKGLIAESVSKVESGARLVGEAGSTMDDVVTSFGLVANLVTEISNASREQSSGIEQVTQAVGQMDEATQQNAALVEEAAAAAESLEEQARQLVEAVGMFKLNSHLPALAKGAGVDFDAMVQAHEQWKVKLHNYLEGQGDPLDPEVVCRDDKCALGQWIYGAGRTYSKLGSYEPLRGEHANFHRCAADVIRRHLDDDAAAAKKLLHDDFSVQSARTVRHIRALQHEVLHGDRPALAAPAPAIVLPATVPERLSMRQPPAHLVDREDEWKEF